MCTSISSKEEALSYKSCIAHDNPYKVSTYNIVERFTTFDCEISLMSLKPRRHEYGRGWLLYVGVVQEIMHIMYTNHPTMIFSTSCVPANVRGNTNIKRDAYGFWLVDSSGGNK